MRVVAGKHRGRMIISPSGNGIRPTSDRTREAIFNVLSNLGAIEGSKALDLCCGTGALGIEALSRGAKSCVFVDGSAEHLKLAWHNITRLKEQDNVTMMRAFAEDLPEAKEQFNLVLLDPPYFKKIAEQALNSLLKKNWLKNYAIIVVELAKTEDILIPVPLAVLNTKYYGNTKIIFLTLSLN